MEKIYKTAIVVSSCDAFQDCWKPFLYSIEKWGNNCPFKIYIVSNFISISYYENDDKIEFLKIGNDQKWASNLRNALQSINSDYIIYLQEDYFLSKSINWSDLQTHIAYCIRNDIDYLRLSFPYIPGKIIDKYYVENSLEEAYAVCLQSAIWKKDVLESLCVEGWSGWDFERNVSLLIRKRIPNFRFLGLTRSAKGQIHIVKGTGVRKGKWTNSGYHFLHRNGFENLLAYREKEPFYWGLLDVDGWLRPFAKIIWKIINKITRNN